MSLLPVAYKPLLPRQRGCRALGRVQGKRFLGVAAILGTSLCLQAQLTRSTLSGSVMDPSGARIPAARIWILEINTNAERVTQSNELGLYRLTAVNPGTYIIEFSAPGFKTRQIKNVLLQSAREVILNQSLSIIDESIGIEVRESPGPDGLLDTSLGTSRSFDQDTVAALPFSNTLRDPRDLAAFMPLVVRAPAFSGLSAGGQRSRNHNFLLDGADNNELSVTGSSLRLIAEAVSELRVQYPAYSAEFGRSSGTRISAITRSGSNALHGSVWDFYRADWLDPLSLLDKRAGFQKAPRFVNNQVGGSLGGPIRKDHTFFYGLLETSRLREAANSRNAVAVTIPTVSGYAALSSLPLATGQDPVSRQQVLHAISFLPEIYKRLGEAGNSSTQIVNSVPIEFQTIRVPLANPSNNWYGMLRGDQHLNPASSLSYRFMFDKRSQPNSTSNLQFAGRYAAASEMFNQNHILSLTHAFGLSWMSENRFSYARSNLAFPENDPISPTVQVLGTFTFGGLSSFPQGRIANIFQWQNINSHSSGRHMVKFGVDLRRNRLYNLAAFDSKGTWTFNNFTDFINSRPSRLRHSLTDPTYDARQTIQSYFFQDDLRLMPNFSLNLGLRYELSGVPFGFFGTTDAELIRFDIPGPTKRDLNNFAPRLGFAFVPAVHSSWARRVLGESESVIRGGFAMNYDVIFLNILTIAAGNFPRAIKYDKFAPDTFNLFPQLLPRPTQIPSFDPVQFPFANTPADMQHPTSHHWTVSLQRQVGSQQTYEIGYVGNRTYHLLRQSERNPGLLSLQQAVSVINGETIPSVQARRMHPEWASRASLESTAISKYHALFVRFDQNALPGLNASVNLTWSRTFSDNDEPLAVGDIVLSSPQLPQNVFDYKSEWSRSVFDRPLRLSALFSYNFPKPAGFLAADPLLQHIFSAWKISGSAEWQSGQPFTVTTGVDSGGSGIPVAWRPDLIPGGILEPDPVEGNLRTFGAPDIFSTPRNVSGGPLANSMPHGGSLGRNTFRGPAFVNWNMNFSKTIEISEHLRIILRGDIVNIWNHRNFGNPVANINSSAFGSNTSDPGNRSAMLSAKFSF